MALLLVLSLTWLPLAAAAPSGATTYSKYIEADDSRLEIGIYGYASVKSSSSTHHVLVAGDNDRTAQISIVEETLGTNPGGTITLTLTATNETVTMSIAGDGSFEVVDDSDNLLAEWAWNENEGDFEFIAHADLIDSAAAYVLFAVLGDAEFSAVGAGPQALILIPAVLAWCILQCKCCTKHYQNILNGTIPANTPEPACCGRCLGTTCSVFGLV